MATTVNDFRIVIGRDMIVQCLCNSNAGLKFNRVSKTPFIACFNYFAHKQTKCELFIDLANSDNLNRLNELKGTVFIFYL